MDGLAIVRPRALFGDWVGFKGVGKYSKYQISKLDVLSSISYNGIYFPLDYIQSTFTCNDRSQEQKATVKSVLTFVLKNVG